MQTMKDGPSSENVLGFATLLRRYRRTAGLTQVQLAERAGLSAKAISSLERGVNRFPRRDTLQLLFDALQLDEEQRRLLEASRVVSQSDALAAAGLRAHVAERMEDALGSHIAHLRTSEHHPPLVDALLVRALIAIRTHRWRAAMEDLDEAISRRRTQGARSLRTALYRDRRIGAGDADRRLVDRARGICLAVPRRGVLRSEHHADVMVRRRQTI
jgi:transcriptional regulator with XRE-family HTH domain